MRAIFNFLHLFKSNKIVEWVRLNYKDDRLSLFPPDKFTVWVQREKNAKELPNIHIYNIEEDFQVKIYIDTYTSWRVEKRGKRARSDRFSDITQLLELWFEKQTQFPSRIGTNRQAALDGYDSCN